MVNTMQNPYKPGAGHTPPYLAGRQEETGEFNSLLDQDIILQNVIISGLRGIGKTVLLESFQPLARKKKWLWAGTDCSESVSVSEEMMALRILTDVAVVTSHIKIFSTAEHTIGFKSEPKQRDVFLDFDFLTHSYNITPGLVSDKLKATLETVWNNLKKNSEISGIVFAYDEAQLLGDRSQERQYPLSLLLDVFNSIQKKDIPFMLVLTGLPTLLTNLVETRTYSERLFRILMLDKLSPEESRKAILTPIQNINHPLQFNENSIDLIVKSSEGYPYLIQYICREVYDIFLQQVGEGTPLSVPMEAIMRKLDGDFFSGRWAKATEREKELLQIIALAKLNKFRVSQVVELSKKSSYKAFTRPQISAMFKRLIKVSLIYRNIDGDYSFAIPLLDGFIRRFHERESNLIS